MQSLPSQEPILEENARDFRLHHQMNGKTPPREDCRAITGTDSAHRFAVPQCRQSRCGFQLVFLVHSVAADKLAALGRVDAETWPMRWKLLDQSLQCRLGRCKHWRERRRGRRPEIVER